MYGRTVTAKIKFADFKIATRSRTLPGPVADRETLRTVAVELVRTVYPPRTGIRLLGVTVSNFDAPETATAAQMALAF
jgi:DNA polymerase-4